MSIFAAAVGRKSLDVVNLLPAALHLCYVSSGKSRAGGPVCVARKRLVIIRIGGYYGNERMQLGI